MAKKSSLKIKCHSLNAELPCWYCWVCLGEVGQEWWSPETRLSITNRQQTLGGRALCQACWRDTRENTTPSASSWPAQKGRWAQKQIITLPLCGRKRAERWLYESPPLSLHSNCPQSQHKWPKISFPDLQLSLSIALFPAHPGILSS